MPDDLRIVFYNYHAYKTQVLALKNIRQETFPVFVKRLRGAHLDMSLLYPPKQIWREMANHAAFILQC